MPTAAQDQAATRGLVPSHPGTPVRPGSSALALGPGQSIYYSHSLRGRAEVTVNGPLVTTRAAASQPGATPLQLAAAAPAAPFAGDRDRIPLSRQSLGRVDRH